MHSPIRFKKETLEHNIKNVFIYQPNHEKSIIKKISLSIVALS